VEGQGTEGLWSSNGHKNAGGGQANSRYVGGSVFGKCCGTIQKGGSKMRGLEIGRGGQGGLIGRGKVQKGHRGKDYEGGSEWGKEGGGMKRRGKTINKCLKGWEKVGGAHMDTPIVTPINVRE